MYLFEGVTHTEELYEALRKDGFQSLTVAESGAREFFFFLRIDTSLLRAACWTMASGMMLANHVETVAARKYGRAPPTKLSRELQQWLDTLLDK